MSCCVGRPHPDPPPPRHAPPPSHCLYDSDCSPAPGLPSYGPNINMVKDPRYGRNSEIAGEDPFLTGTYAQHYLQGMQQTASGANDTTYGASRHV